MTVVYEDERTSVLRFDRGESVLERLTGYCQEKQVDGAHFTAIGAASDMELAWYDPERQEYARHRYHGLWEIASAVGNVALADGEVALHVHGVFSTQQETVAGHIMSLTVGGVCEVVIQRLSQPLRRAYDASIGLKVLQDKTTE